MRLQRIADYKKLEELRGSKLLVYVTSDRTNAEASIGADIIAPFANHLDIIKKADKISLFLYSNGGNTLTAWNLVSLIRNYCKELEIIIPFKCQSTATLISLGANRIVMTKQATLGPIDPSTNGPTNPEVNFGGQMIKIPVSVEHVNGFIDMAKNDFGISNEKEMSEIFLKLTEHIHPLALGHVYKSKAQITMLAEKLLQFHEIDAENIPKIVKFLCSDSGSHDYTINRVEAKDELGLNVEKPNDELYDVIKSIYMDIETEMELRTPFNPTYLVNQRNPYDYELRRALIESVDGGTDVFQSTGQIIIASNPSNPGHNYVSDNRIFEGWIHEN